MARLLAIIGILLGAQWLAYGDAPAAELVKLLPPNVGEFRQSPSITPLAKLAKEDNLLRPDILSASAQPAVGGEADYLSRSGGRFTVELIKTPGDSDAYSLLTLLAKQIRAAGETPEWKAQDFAVSSVLWSQGMAFAKGPVFIKITAHDSKPENSGEERDLAQLLAAPLDPGENDVPVLLKHLPDWQTFQPSAVYLVNIAPLRDTIQNQPILNEISFEGGAEAVTAIYERGQLLIVEFTTPQLSGDADRRIAEKIQALRGQGEPSPTAYRRVGNYSVFVFHAADEQAANRLIDQVKYEQVVQWLGDNPHWYERALREWTNTSAGVMIAVLETSGLSLLVCLGAGGLIGALVFRRRRAQHRAAALYSDAGGMVRLNLDDMTSGSPSETQLTLPERTSAN